LGLEPLIIYQEITSFIAELLNIGIGFETVTVNLYA